MGLFPTIMKPSRRTPDCAFPIDNIFTNNTDNNLMSGLLIIDVSHHLPIFIVYEGKDRVDAPRAYLVFFCLFVFSHALY